MSVLKEEGDHQVTIVKAEIVMGRWNNRPDDMDVKLTGEAEDGTTAAWYGELSNHYIQSGKLAGQTSYAVTMQTLQSLGFQGEDLSQIDSITGTQTVFAAVRNAKGYINYYINANPEKVISPAEAAAKLRLMFPQAQAVQQQQQAQSPEQKWYGQQQQQPQQGQFQLQQQPQQQQPQQQYQQPANGSNPFN